MADRMECSTTDRLRSDQEMKIMYEKGIITLARAKVTDW